MIFRMRASASGQLLTNGRDELKLGTGLITYLKKWYAEQKSGVREEIHSKYFDKGNQCEQEAIDVTASMLGLGILEKNIVHFNDEHFNGTPDVITDELVIDTKCNWDYASFLDAVTGPINTDYEAQLQVYMHLTGMRKAKLVYVLLDTPAECNYGNEVLYSHMPIEERFFVFDLEYSEEYIAKLIEKVNNCKLFIESYDSKVKSLSWKFSK